MSASDTIKDVLARAYPNTAEKDWKRRSKDKVSGGIERQFENAKLGITVTTLEDANGKVAITRETGEATVELKPVSPPPPPLTAKELAEKYAEAPLSDEGMEDLPSAPLAPLEALPELPAKAEKVNRRNLFVPNSRWRLTQDVDIHLWVNNPVWDALAYARNRTPADQAEINRMDAAGERVIRVHVATLKAGLVFTPTRKMTADGQFSHGVKKNQTNGMMIPVNVDDAAKVIEVPYQTNRSIRNGIRNWYSGWGATHLFPYNQVEPFAEALEVPKTLVYVLRDTATGEYFGGWKTEKVKHPGNPTYEYERSTNEPKMSAKFSGSKKYATSSAVKASIRDFTGYNVGLEEQGEGPEYYLQGGEKKIDLPPTWEMVAVDKTTGAVDDVIDVQNWFKALMRLRVLTKGFGTAVRGVYKKAEGVEGLEVIITFQNRSRGTYTEHKTGALKHWDEPEPFSEQRDEGVLKAIDGAVKTMGGKKLRHKSETAIAVACSLSDAVMAKLAFDSDAPVQIKMLDIKTLEEVVHEQ